jgi:hypothetical protein
VAEVMIDGGPALTALHWGVLGVLLVHERATVELIADLLSCEPRFVRIALGDLVRAGLIGFEPALRE